MFARLPNIKYIHFRSFTDVKSVKISKDIVKGLNKFNGTNERICQIEVVSFHNMKNCDFDYFTNNEVKLNIKTVGIFNTNVTQQSMKSLSEFLINLK